MEYYGNLASMPSFLSESNLWDGLFSPKSRHTLSKQRANARRYLGSHRYGISPGENYFEPIPDSKRLIIEVCLSLLERGEWTLPSWKIESHLAAKAINELGLKIAPISDSSGELRLKFTNSIDEKRLSNVLVPTALESEFNRDQAIEAIVKEIDSTSPGEELFLREIVATTLPISLLCLLTPQRPLTSMGLDSRVFKDQCVDFALETPHGDRLVIEIDGSQHQSEAAQLALDKERDFALSSNGWTVWRIATSELNKTEALSNKLLDLIKIFRFKVSENGRDKKISELIWTSTVISRIQALMLEALLCSAIPSEGITDLDKYAVVPGTKEFINDLYVD